MAGVKARDGENFESVLKRFKRSVEQEKILSEIKKHQNYEKPSEKRKRKIMSARKRLYMRRNSK